MIWYELASWSAYLRVKHEGMSIYRLWLPLSAAVVGLISTLAFPQPPLIFGEKGLVSGVLQVVAQLPGFFIAALAAVATFDRPEMDEVMPVPAPTLEIFREGRLISIALTRRSFLTHLFAYLSALSIIISVVCVLVNSFSPSVSGLLNLFSSGVCLWAKFFLKSIFLLSFYFLCSSMLVVTMQGLYFLGERMHQPH